MRPSLKPHTALDLARVLIPVLLCICSTLVSAASLPSWLYVSPAYELRNVQMTALSPVANDLLIGGAFNASTGLVTRIDDAGNLLWSRSATATTVGNGLVCGGVAGDADGNMIVMFEFNGVLTLGETTFSNPGSSKGFVVAKLDATGKVLWGQTVLGAWGGSSNYAAGQLRVDPGGNVLVFFDHTTSVTVGNLTLSADAYGRSALLKISPAGVVLWLKDISSSGNQGYVTFDSIAADTNSVYVTGFFNKYVGWGATNISASAVTSFVGRMNSANGTPDWIRNTGGGAQGSECALAPDGVLWAKMAQIGSWNLLKYKTNGVALVSVPGLNHGGKMRILPNGEVVILGSPGYFARFDTNGALAYASTNIGASLPGITNATSYEVNADGDAYLVGTPTTNIARVAAAKVRAPGFFPEITVQPPAITNQPSVFSSFVVSVTAAGAPVLNYQWRLNGTNVAGATNRTLTRTNVTPAESGLYDCVIRNDYGAVTSRVYTVKVGDAVSFAKLPGAQLVLLEQATLTSTNITADDCSIAALVGKTLSCTITNQASGWPAQGGFDFQILSGNNFGGGYSMPTGVFGFQASSYTLSFNGIGAVYLALSHFPDFTSSSIIRFYSGGWFTLERNPNPSGSVCRGIYSISGGTNTAGFSVSANGGAGVGSLAYQWQKDGVDIPNATNSTITVSPVTITDAGRYRCVVTAYDSTRTASYAVTSLDAPLRVVANVAMPPASYTLAPGGATLNITWAAGYVLQFTPSLSPQTWATVATSSPFTAETTAGQGYFRIVKP